MPYIITSDTVGLAIGPVSETAINVHEALSKARQMYETGLANLSIQDEAGHKIDSDDLLDCITGKKRITNDRKGHAGSGDQQRHQDDHGFGRCRFTCAPSASRDCADERAFHLLLNALHRTSANAALARDLAHAFAGAQLRLDTLFDGGIDFRPTELLALRDRALEASVDTLTDHAAFKLGKGTADLKHELA